MSKPETKKAQKARGIVERKAAKEAAKLAEHSRVFATPLAKATEPLKVRAVATAELRAKENVEKKMAQLKEAGWDLNKVAPAGNSLREGRETYRGKQDYRASFERLTKRVKGASGYDQSWRDMTIPRIVERDQDGIDRYIEMCCEMAAAQYDSFVYKMVSKVGDHTAAELKTNWGIWEHSILVVTLKDGTVQKWKTQTIINFSVYGKMFNQWPSRIVK